MSPAGRALRAPSRRAGSALAGAGWFVLLGACAGPLTGTDRVPAYLSDDHATRLVVDVWDGTGGQAPDGTWTTLRDDLARVVSKPDGVEVAVSQVSLEGGPWSHEALEDAAQQLALPEPAGTIRLDVLVVPGRHEDGDGVIGAAWDHRRVALFADAVDAACLDDAPSSWSDTRVARACGATWSGTLLHEVGHVLGLVDAGAPMVVDHEDPDHPHHDPRPGCLMHWAYDGVALAAEIRRRAETDDRLWFCAESEADMAAVRAGDLP